jgi:hypothetical protein
MYLSAKAGVEKRENTNKNAINNFFILTSTNNVRLMGASLRAPQLTRLIII